jgi:CheY-like chemotaxis protein
MPVTDAMHKDVIILICDDDEGHARLIERNLRRAALNNPIERFADGQELLDFLFRRGERQAQPDTSYLILLDVRMPKLDGVEVLRQLKEDPELRKIPVLMLTTTDDPREVQRCHAIGCSHYIVKPVDYEHFADAISRLGHFVTLVKVPEIN